jgi:hypothetical protein
LVVKDSKPKRYQTTYDLTQADYQKLSAHRVSEALQKVRNDLKEISNAAEQAVKEIQPFTFEAFKRDFVCIHPLFKFRKQKQPANLSDSKEFDFSKYEKDFPILKEKHTSPDSISTVFVWYVQCLIKEERIGSAFNYQDTYHSLKKFGGNVKFIEITPSYLRQYEKWMLNRNCSKSTVGINLRPLRAIYNLAIDEFSLIPRKNYPFGSRRYLIPNSKNIKKSIPLNDISEIYYYKTNSIDHKKARDFWLF